MPSSSLNQETNIQPTPAHCSAEARHDSRASSNLFCDSHQQLAYHCFVAKLLDQLLLAMWSNTHDF